MATEEEIQEMVRKINEGVTLTSDELKKLSKDAVTLGDVFKKVGKETVGLLKDINAGAQGAAAFNKGITSATDIVGDFAGQFGILGKVIGFSIKALGAYTAEANKLSDRLFKSYQDLSKIGASANDGMKGLADSAMRLGYGLDDIDMANFGKLMQGAAQDLALMSGTVSKGRKDFAEFASEITKGQAGYELKLMGQTVDEINSGLATYMGMQTRIGMTQGKTTEELRKGAVSYLKEMDALTKATGIQKSELEEGINKARGIEQFRAKLDEMRASGDEKLIAAAAEAEKYYAVMAKRAPGMAQGFAETFGSGSPISKAGQQFFFTMGASTEMVEAMRSGALKAGEALDQTSVAAKKTSEEWRGLAQYGAAGDVIGDFAEKSNLGAMSAQKLANALEEAEEQIKNQIENGDKNVANQVEARTAQKEMQQQMNQLVNLGVGPATSAMASLATVTNKVVSGLGGVVSAPPGPRATTAAAAPAAAKPPAAAPAAAAGAAVATTATPTKPAAPPVPITDRTATGFGGGASMMTGGKAGQEQQKLLLSALSKAGITDDRAMANIMAQVQAESGFRSRSEELGRYSAKNLFSMYGAGNKAGNKVRFQSLEEAQAIVAQGPEAVGNLIYGGRMGNAANEGFLYRGRGLIQLTGKDNYATYGKKLGIDLVNNPDLANDPEIAAQIAAAYFKEKGQKVDLTDIAAVGKAVGYAGGQKETEKRAQLAQGFSTQLAALKNVPVAANGGTFSGPRSGYPAVLHGSEAVVPLPDGRTIPVSMPDLASSMGEQLGLMTAQISKFDELISLMRDQTSISQKILQTANA